MPPRVPLLPRNDLKALLQACLQRANQPPHDGSLPLFIAGYRCGWLFPPIAVDLKRTTGVEISATEAHIGRGMVPGTELDALLATIAAILRAAGRAPGWRNELLDVWSDSCEDSIGSASPKSMAPPVRMDLNVAPGQVDSGTPPVRVDSSTPPVHADSGMPPVRSDSGVSPVRVGAIERGVMRPLGLVTRAVHLNGWSADGRLWVARRALSKATDPGMWDTLVGGLIGAGEPEQLALVRECDEEAGLDPQDIAPRNALHQITRMRRRIPEGYQSEDVLTCECVLAPHVVPKNRDGEVMEIKCLTPAEVLTMLQQGAFTVEATIVIAEDLLRNCTGGH